MRILASSDVPHYLVAGSNTFVTQLAQGLRARGHDLAVLCASKRFHPQTYIENEIRVFGISSFPWIPHHALRVAFPIGIRAQIIRVFEQFQPDLVHVQSHGPLPTSVVGVAEYLDIPTMATNHFVPDNIIHQLHVPVPLQPLVKRLMWKHVHCSFGRLDCITTPTDTAKRILHESGFRKDIRVISNGIDLTRFHPDNASQSLRASLLQKYRIHQKPILLSVGRLDPEKNLQFLIETIPLVIDTLDMQLVIVGTGTEGRHLKALVRERHLEQHIVFTGYVPCEDLPAMYGLARCFIMPGTAELQGIALMEAMASGLPVLGADALALPELIQDGENGFLFGHKDSQAVARHIGLILKDEELQRRMGARSVELIQKHDVAYTIDAFEELYGNVIQSHKQGYRDNHPESTEGRP